MEIVSINKKESSMKNFKLVAMAALAILAGHMAYPYAIVHDKDSAVNSVQIYVFKDKDNYTKYLRAEKVPEQVIGVADKLALAAPAVGAALAVPTEGASLIVAGGFTISVQVVKQIINALQATGLRGAALRKAAGVIAWHDNVVKGNKGRGAEWNWASIEKQYGVPRGGKLFIVVTDKEKGIPLLQSELASDGLLGFTVKRDPKGQLYAEQSSAVAAQYVPAN